MAVNLGSNSVRQSIMDLVGQHGALRPHHDCTASRHEIRRLIINADDMGRDVRITRNILRCIDRGVVTSASIMPNMPCTDMALKEAKSRCNKASFGVHLTLCEGRPLTKAASLTDRNGDFLEKRGLVYRILTGLVCREELRSELNAQIAAIAHYGMPVSHLDSHKHVHHLPPVAAILIDLARTFDIAHIRCIPTMFGTEGRSSTRFYMFRFARNLLLRQTRKLFEENGLRSPDHCLDLSTLLSSEPNTFESLLWGNGATTELICHLSEFRKNGGIDEQMRFLLSSSLSAVLERTRSARAAYWDI